jgi:uncharacterized RDD family membrane protein YckC
MQAWRLKVERNDGRPVDWPTALRRYLAALLSWSVLGLGFLWQIWDPEHLTWHDRLSRTRLVHYPRRKSSG